MRRGTLTLLLFITLIAAGASFVVFWPNSDAHGKPGTALTTPLPFQKGWIFREGFKFYWCQNQGTKCSITQDSIQNTANMTWHHV